MPARPPAPRDFVNGFAYALPGLTCFTCRYDDTARKWRDPADAGRVLGIAQVLDAAESALREAIEAPEPPIVLRAVAAPTPEAAASLAAITDWQTHADDSHAAQVATAHRLWEAREDANRAKRERLQALAASGAPADADRLAERLTPREFVAPPRPDLVNLAQRERWLHALTPHRVREAVYRASGLPALRYAPASGADDFERRWLASLPRVPGARLSTADLRAAYEAACPPGHTPLHDRALKALAVQAFGETARKRTSTGWVYLGVCLPGLRLVAHLTDTA